jgi:hypothetical protein
LLVKTSIFNSPHKIQTKVLRNYLTIDKDTVRKGQKRRCLSLMVMIFSGVGFPILQFSGSLIFWMVLIFALNIRPLLRMRVRVLFLTLVLIISYILIFILKGAKPPYFLIVAILTALIVLSNYLDSGNKFVSDFSKISHIFMYYSLLSIPVMIFGSNFFSEIVLGYSRYFTMGYVFWFVPTGGPSIFNEFRMTGLAWEPGIWQMFLNINFLFALCEKRSNLQLFLAVVSTLCCFSTTGILVTLLTFILYILFIARGFSIRQWLLPVLVICLFSPLIMNNISEKIDGRHMGSGATRIADFFTGGVLLLNNPILGADKELATASNNELIAATKAAFWRGNYKDGAFEAYMDVKNSNGYMIFLLDWGLPVGIFLLTSLFRSNFINHRRFNTVLMLIILITMSAQAISRTSFFYFFILASLFSKKINNASHLRYGNEKN